LTIHREIGDRGGEGNDLSGLGIAYAELGDARRAIGYYEQALAIHREIGDRRGEGNALGNLGIAYKNLGDARRAIGCYEQAIAIRQQIGDLMGVATDSFNMALLHVQQGEGRAPCPWPSRQRRSLGKSATPSMRSGRKGLWLNCSGVKPRQAAGHPRPKSWPALGR